MYRGHSWPLVHPFAVGSQCPLMSYLLALLLAWTAMLLGILRCLQGKPEARSCMPAKATRSQGTQTAGGTLANSTYFPQDAIFVTPHGRSFHTKTCPHVQRSSKRYDPCKDCLKRRD